MADSQTQLQRDHKTLRGKILYTSKKPDRMDQERGREYFQITLHKDGTRTILVCREIDDAPSVMANICMTVGADWHPKDCSVRLDVGDTFMGSGWFNFGDTFVECEASTKLEGRISQRMDLGSRCHAFQNHAIACDSWHMNFYDMEKGGVQLLNDMILSSPDHRGATGPMMFKVDMGVQFVGREEVAVGAGTFKALHFQMVSTPGLPQEHPPYDVWCTDDGHFTLLKAGVGGYMQTHYELVELYGSLS